MRKFIVRILSFASVITLLLFMGVFMPVTPRASKSLLFSKSRKDSLLTNTKSPRVIFIGGSNLSFGLNSQLLLDSLRLNPINTGIHASLGLVYMLHNVIPFVKPRDIIVISPEYDQYYGEFSYGQEELLRIVMDTNPLAIIKLSKEQLFNILLFLPKYCFSKFNPVEYLYTKEDPVYSINSFNKFGDVNTHWTILGSKVSPYPEIHGDFNEHIIDELKSFNSEAEHIGAKVLFTFPCYQEASYEKSKEKIVAVEHRIKSNGFTVISKPADYKIPDSLLFNTPYHLSKKGVDLRTLLLIRDINIYIKNKSI